MVVIHEIQNKSSALKLYSTLKAMQNRLGGAYIVEINGTPVFTKDEWVAVLKELRKKKVETFEIWFAPERKLNKQLDEGILFLLVGPPAPLITHLVETHSSSQSLFYWYYYL